MKNLILITISLGFMAAPALALPSLSFTTEHNSTFSWTLSSGDGTNWTLSFAPGSMEVDGTNPSPDAVMDDLVDLPSMTLGAINDQTTYLIAPLTTSGSVTITDVGTAQGTVMTASLGSGSTLVIGTDYVAYSAPQDDLDMVSYTAAYSTVIDDFNTYDTAGAPWDLSFTGQASGGKNLYTMLTAGVADSATGTISGQSSIIIPAPGAILLGSIGVGLVGWLRRRRAL